MTAPGAGIVLTEDIAMRVGDGDADWMRPFPVRDGCRVTPLIEAADMYPALERLVLGAEHSICLAFRVLDPGTRTRSDEARALDLPDWTALLVHAAERGVTVRLLLTDFEPVMADALHAGSWSSFNRLRAAMEGWDDAKRARLQIIVIQHEGEVGWGIRQLLRLALARKMRGLVSSLLDDNSEDGGIEVRPGLWRHLLWDGERPSKFRVGPPPRLWPATYHQKFVVIDGKRAVVGGLDLNERRWDDRRHRQRADRTWHDISSLVEGPAVGDASAHFARLWNQEVPRFRALVAEWTDGGVRELALEPLEPMDTPPAPGQVGTARVQMARTLSRRSAKLLAFGPKPHIRELRAAHRLLIEKAERRLYVEAQFFRSRAAGEWVEAALRANPRLEVIILVANVPEEVAFEGQGSNPAHRHGEWLQARALGRIRKVAPDRVGLFSLAKPEAVRPSEEQFEADRGTAYGSGVIHIHAKLLIADDAACLLSSANINGRSFQWDTEFGLIWSNDEENIRAFRLRLWRQLLGPELGDRADLAAWREIADRNRRSAPEERQGFVVPYQLVRARRWARPYWFVPDDLV